MGVFKEMDPELARRAIEGYQDELSPELEKQRSFYAGFSCPRCKCALDQQVDPRTAFTGDQLIAKALLHCGNCGYEIEPHTGVVISFGDASKTPVTTIPILGGKYLPDF